MPCQTNVPMKRAYALVLAAVAFAGLLMIAAAAVADRGLSRAAPPAAIIDEGEPNDSFEEATGVGLADTVSGKAANEPITDTDFFVVQTGSGLTYRAEFQASGAGVLLLKLVIYDHERDYFTNSTSSGGGASVSWTAYGDKCYIEVQPSGPVTTTTLQANYTLDVLRVAATPTPTPEPAHRYPNSCAWGHAYPRGGSVRA